MQGCGYLVKAASLARIRVAPHQDFAPIDGTAYAEAIDFLLGIPFVVKYDEIAKGGQGRFLYGTWGGVVQRLEGAGE
jgi:hypothetical protein